MSAFSSEEVEQFEEIGFQNEKEARLGYLEHGQPLSQRHKLYLQEKERQRRGGGAGSRPSSVPQSNPYETYQERLYSNSNSNLITNAGPSTYAAQTYAPRGFEAWSSQAYSIGSPSEQPLPDDNTTSASAPSSGYLYDSSGYNSPSSQPIQPQQSNGQTPVVRTMMQVRTTHTQNRNNPSQ